jgi:hypothetical protein
VELHVWRRLEPDRQATSPIDPLWSMGFSFVQMPSCPDSSILRVDSIVRH